MTTEHYIPEDELEDSPTPKITKAYDIDIPVNSETGSEPTPEPTSEPTPFWQPYSREIEAVPTKILERTIPELLKDDDYEPFKLFTSSLDLLSIVPEIGAAAAGYLAEQTYTHGPKAIFGDKSEIKEVLDRSAASRAAIGKSGWLPWEISDAFPELKEIHENRPWWEQQIASTWMDIATVALVPLKIVRFVKTGKAGVPTIAGSFKPVKEKIKEPFEHNYPVIAGKVDPTTIGHSSYNAMGVIPNVISEKVFGFRPMQVGLTQDQDWGNLVKNTFLNRSKGLVDISPTQPLVQGWKAERKRILPIISSVAQEFSQRHHANLTSVFEFDELGRVVDPTGKMLGINSNVPGQPTIQDIAEFFPSYRKVLTDPQIKAMESLRDDIAPFKQLLDQLGYDVHNIEIVEGGFYLPRGGTSKKGKPDYIPEAVRGFGKKSFEKPRSAKSMSETLEEKDGYVYPLLRDSLFGYVKEVGHRAFDQHTANFFKSLVDPDTGIRIGETPKQFVMRTAMVLRDSSGKMRLIGPEEKIPPTAVPLGTLKKSLDDRLKGLKQMLPKLDDEYRDAIDEWLYSHYKQDPDVLWETKSLEALANILTSIKVGRNAAGHIGVNFGMNPPEVKALIGLIEKELYALKPLWKKSMKAAEARRGVAPIRLYGLDGTDFPSALAKAVNDTLEEGFLGKVADVASYVNLPYRFLRATYDNSGIGIQGLLGIADSLVDPRYINNPKLLYKSPGARSISVNIRAWKDPDVLGKYLVDFNKRTEAAGRFTSRMWAEFGVQIGGIETEMTTAGASMLIKGARKIPGVDQANRAFGFFGDSLRLSWADDMLLEELAKGRTLKDIVDSGDAERIAGAVNNMTGYSPKKLGGDLGEIAMFAPRFLQARLETVFDALKSAQSLVPGREATLKQRLARRSILKLIAGTAFMTEGINQINGHETDWNPIIISKYDGKPMWNPNFMRFRALGRDWSFLGPYDSVARLLVSVGTANFEGVRGMASGVGTLGWDLIVGRDFEGNKIEHGNIDFRDPNSLPAYIFKQFLPFGAEEGLGYAAEIGEGVWSGDPEMAAEGFVKLSGEMFGIKSTPVTFNEQKMEVRDGLSKKKFGVGYEELDAQQQFEVNQESEVQDIQTAQDEDGLRRGTPYYSYKQEKDEAWDEYIARLTILERKLTAGNISPRDFRKESTKELLKRINIYENIQTRYSKELSDMKGEFPLSNKQLDQDISVYQKELYGDDKPPLDTPETGYDYEEREKRLTKIKQFFMDDSGSTTEGQNRYDKVVSFLNRNEPKIIQELRRDQNIMKPYFDITQTLLREWEDIDPKLTEGYKRYKASITPDVVLREYRYLKAAIKSIANAKAKFLEHNPEIRRLLVKWGYLKATKYEQLQIVAERE